LLYSENVERRRANLEASSEVEREMRLNQRLLETLDEEEEQESDDNEERVDLDISESSEGMTKEKRE
jgi:hypothetical protein